MISVLSNVTISNKNDEKLDSLTMEMKEFIIIFKYFVAYYSFDSRINWFVYKHSLFLNIYVPSLQWAYRSLVA